MLDITEEEKELGFKHVFQTRLTKKSIGERLRSPMGMFSKEETYIDNDAQNCWTTWLNTTPSNYLVVKHFLEIREKTCLLYSVN